MADSLEKKRSEFARAPESTAAAESFDVIIAEMRSVCADPDDPVHGMADRLVAARDAERKALEGIADCLERDSRCTSKGHPARVEHLHSDTCDCGLIARIRAIAGGGA